DRAGQRRAVDRQAARMRQANGRRHLKRLAKARGGPIIPPHENGRDRMNHLPPTGDDRLIWDLWEAQFRFPAATVADELGVFRALSEAAPTTGELAQSLSLDPH